MAISASLALMEIQDPRTGQTFVRKLRKRDDDGSPRELTFTCFRRLPLLSKDRTRLWFVEVLNAARRNWPIDLWAWVLMPEHVHLLVSPRDSKMKIGRFAGEVKREVARQAVAWLEANSPEFLEKLTVVEGNRIRRRFWQPGGGYDRNVYGIEALSAMIEYIHMNPVRRGLVQRPEDWEWSSAQWYAGLRPACLTMDETLPMLYVPRR